MEFFSYTFSPIPSTTFGFGAALLIYIIVLFVLGIAIKILVTMKKDDKALRKSLIGVPSQFIWSSIILFNFTWISCKWNSLFSNAIFTFYNFSFFNLFYRNNNLSNSNTVSFN